MAEKLTKKQRKALEFKKGKKEKSEPESSTVPEAEPPKTEEIVKVEKPKKSKRFIVFVGNLPYNLPEKELLEHFKTANPSSARVREKGFAFLEFEGPNAAKDLNTALKFHHSTLKYRKINVELSAGGGGNSANRRKKLETKNKILHEELNQKIEEEKKQPKPSKRKAPSEPQQEPTKKRSKREKPEVQPADLGGVHPARLRNFK